MIDAASATNDATGASVVDNGPPAPPAGGDEATVTGTIFAQLHGRRGELNGAVLDDGTVLRLPPPEAARLSDSLQVGRSVTARGNRTSSDLGSSMDVSALGATADQLSQVDAPPRPPKGQPRRPPPPPPHG
jgi:hypothetical protein